MSLLRKYGIPVKQSLYPSDNDSVNKNSRVKIGFKCIKCFLCILLSEHGSPANVICKILLQGEGRLHNMISVLIVKVMQNEISFEDLSLVLFFDT